MSINFQLIKKYELNCRTKKFDKSDNYQTHKLQKNQINQCHVTKWQKSAAKII